ncbi:MAG: SAM-dependent methyltransferase [Clostridia bacterium]|nr:SAM-dependent methyltransferase [Clostridia bacterium]
MKTKADFISLVLSTVSAETLGKLVFSRPDASEIAKVTARLVSHKGKRLLAIENSLVGNTVSHKNVPEDEIEGVLSTLVLQYKQANLITPLGSAEYKRSKSGAEIVIGGDALLSKLSGLKPSFESAIEALDKKKNYILKGDEPFLKKLGISSSDGRVHDKKQGKFRQINRFLENIEDIYDKLNRDGELIIYDLCCGKSYLSFAVYYYLTEVKGRKVSMLGIDLKRDVIAWCSSVAAELGYVGMKFVCEDINRLALCDEPDMVISLHACDIATDIVINTAIRLRAKILLSTPCCHRYLNDKINSPELAFVTKYPHISGKLCEAITDALRVGRLRGAGYSVSALELTDPENTPKNTLIRAIRRPSASQKDNDEALKQYEAALKFVLGDGAKDYLKEIR